MFGQLALATAALFTGAAVYINWAEQPARLQLDDGALLTQWKPSYASGFTMQASLAVLGFVFGVLEWIVTNNALWLLGASVLVSNWPYTMLVIMPTNTTLKNTAVESAGPATRALIEKWGRLHAVRSILGGVSTILFLWASR
ncbi:MAG: DUF1772 domain-containing protein [Hyphomicrobium sp.]|nr:DUF1772 domain-containing protein [Hyphomicrobium sp.]PPC82765.1 MAG: hypothetical protein CTY40_03965 [Hyphomicrobium sp.]